MIVAVAVVAGFARGTGIHSPKGIFPRKVRKGRNVSQSEIRHESALEILTRDLG